MSEANQRREQVLTWWRSLSDEEKIALKDKHFPDVPIDWNFLPSIKIEQIWLKETPQRPVMGQRLNLK